MKTYLSLAVMLTLALSSAEAKQRGKTYDDLAEILKNANMRISDEQEKQALNSQSYSRYSQNDESEAESKPSAANPKAPTSSL